MLGGWCEVKSIYVSKRTMKNRFSPNVHRLWRGIGAFLFFSSCPLLFSLLHTGAPSLSPSSFFLFLFSLLFSHYTQKRGAWHKLLRRLWWSDTKEQTRVDCITCCSPSCPKTFPQDSGGFEVALNEWEHLVQRWDVLANDILNDAVKRQVLLDMAPAGVRVQLTLAGHTNYEALRSAIMSYLVASRDWNATVNPSDSTSTPMEVDALTPPRRQGLGEDAEETGWRQDWQDLLREGLLESSRAKASGKGKTKGKGGGKGSGKVNSVHEEQCEGDPHADSETVSAVTRNDNWIMVLEREAPQADLSKETGFDVCAVTLRKASGQALQSYGRCDIQVQVPPISDVWSGGCAISNPVGSRTGLQWSQSDVSRTRGGAADGGWNRRTTDTYSRLVVLCGLDWQQQRVRACRQWCNVSCMSARLGHPHEFLEQPVSIDCRERFGNTRTHRWGCASETRRTTGRADAKTKLSDARGDCTPWVNTSRCDTVRGVCEGPRSWSTSPGPTR